ncbi:uncharacterized protein JCM6883_000081 [Sporobolomyces salmoneus]|uniref:uncharacterized protein n=1 Tax=Sporobolomyces salmoneus TaxID=183962 RepID=UPI003181069A
MAAFVPLDSPPVLSQGEEGGGGGNEEPNFLSAADELALLPADLITPLPAYSLYREQEAARHHLPHPSRTRLNSNESFSQPSHAFLPSSSSSWPSFASSSSSSSLIHDFPFSPYSYDPSCISGNSGLSTCTTRGSQSSSFSNPSFVSSPGLQLNFHPSVPSSSYDFANPTYPLTPPIDRGEPSFTFGETSSSTLPPDFQSLPYSSSSSTEKYRFSSAVAPPFDSSTPTSSFTLPLDSVSTSSNSSLAAIVSSGLARRRSRASPLPSPSLSSSSIPSSARPQFSLKGRTSQGGSRSRYARDEVTVTCVLCQAEIATLQLRSQGEALDVDFVAEFVCFTCRPDLVGTNMIGMEGQDSDVGYYSSLSALLDREEGLAGDRKRRRVGSRTNPRKSASRKDANDNSLICDVDRRCIASGSIRPVNPREKLNFTVEVICSHCSATYRRCSDDGGGGGRLGVGKWRCKELFEEGRRNCSFSHARMGAIQDLIYDTHTLSEIEEDLARLESTCFEFFRNAVLAALAVPDVLEGENPIATTYEQIEKMAFDAWTHFETFFKPCANETRRRFIGLRWANPTTRKKGRKNATSPSLFGDDSIGIGSRPGMRLTGFAIMEVDLEHGLLFTPLTMPIGSVGETYDASTTLLQHLSHHFSSDLENLNLVRTSENLPLIPPIEEAWTAVLFSKDTRGTNHLETRRGYLPVDKYCSVHGTTSYEQIRERMGEFVPTCLQGGWRLFVRPYRGVDDDWGQMVTGRRRRRSFSSSDKSSRSRMREIVGEDSDADYEEGPGTRRSKRSRI